MDPGNDGLKTVRLVVRRPSPKRRLLAFDESARRTLVAAAIAVAIACVAGVVLIAILSGAGDREVVNGIPIR